MTACARVVVKFFAIITKKPRFTLCAAFKFGQPLLQIRSITHLCYRADIKDIHGRASKFFFGHINRAPSAIITAGLIVKTVIKDHLRCLQASNGRSVGFSMLTTT